MSEASRGIAITLCTPTYNRAHTLHRVYGSLREQSYRDFEWIVVDDGSTDGTQELVRRWREDSSFPIRYLAQENRGKHVAVNRGLRAARGELFLIVDSDDALIPGALAKVIYHWNSIADDERPRYAGIEGLCVNTEGSVIGQSFPADLFDSNPLENYYKFKIRGDKMKCFRADVMRRFPYPESHDYKFVPEFVLWNRIAREYRVRCVNEPLIVVHHDAGNQLTKRGLVECADMRLFYAQRLTDEIDYFFHDPISFFRAAAHYVRFSLAAGEGLRDQFGRLTSAYAKWLWIVSLIPGATVFWVRDVMVRGANRRSRAKAERCLGEGQGGG